MPRIAIMITHVFVGWYPLVSRILGCRCKDNGFACNKVRTKIHLYPSMAGQTKAASKRKNSWDDLSHDALSSFFLSILSNSSFSEFDPKSLSAFLSILSNSSFSEFDPKSLSALPSIVVFLHHYSYSYAVLL